MAELNCFGKTEHYSDKITLLNTYDTNHNGEIDTTEMQQAAADFFDEKLSFKERDLLVHVWKLGEDGISKFCRRRPPCGDYGDVDGDGWVSPEDMIYTMRHAIFSDEYPMTPDQKRRADVNGDGKVTAVDATLMARYLAGVYDTFTVCAGAPPTPSKPECKEGDVKAGFMCSGGKWVPTGTTTPPVEPPVIPPTSKYLTPDEALLRIRAGEKCYIKCTLPILSMLPGIPYMQGIPILPGFAITTEP